MMTDTASPTTRGVSLLSTLATTALGVQTVRTYGVAVILVITLNQVYRYLWK